MRKRRRLANKMTIMVCAVLIAVSAFFYAPMEVEASEVINFSNEIVENDAQIVSSDELNFDFGDSFNVPSYWYFTATEPVLGSIDLSDYFSLESDSYYKLTVNFNVSSSLTSPWASYPSVFGLRNNISSFRLLEASSLSNGSEFNTNSIIYIKGSDCVFDVTLSTMFFCNVSLGGPQFTCNFNTSFSFSDLEILTSSQSNEYQNGYNAGYSAGEQAGYGNGYSQGFADGEASVDTDAIYDQAFQAGKDSVDTQSYYDAGYQAGYQVAYQEGYESGYDVGYQSAMDRIASWGADTSEYPMQLYSYDMGHTFSTNVTYSVPFSYRDSVKGYLSNVHLNPNHTYRFDVEIYPHDWDSADTITYENEFYFCIGGIDYPLTYFSTNSFLTSLFVPGDRMSDSYYLVWSTIRASVDGTNNICRVVCPYTITLYDMGPSGDTQNHIANQTDQLTNGYDDSKGNQVNSDFSTGLNDYESAENSLFATATTGMKDFTFFDFESVPAMITGMSFIGSIMGSWFNQAGGASGVGIVLSILFSVILVAMVLGLYRWYQSRGGKN